MKEVLLNVNDYVYLNILLQLLCRAPGPRIGRALWPNT